MTNPTTIYSFSFFDWLEPAFTARLEKLNKALTKNNQDPAVIISQTFELRPDPEDHKRMSRFVLINLRAPALVHNGRDVRFVGQVAWEAQTGTKKIFSRDPNIVLGGIDHKTLKCDHCHKVRNRATWSFFMEGNNLLHIGSACAGEYFGIDIESLLTFLLYCGKMEEDPEDKEFGSFREKQVPGVSFETFIRALWLATDGFKKAWVSKDKGYPEQGIWPTSDLVLGRAFPPYGVSETDKEAWREAHRKADTAIQQEGGYTVFLDLIKALPDPRSDFDWNVWNALCEVGADGQVDARTWITFFGPAGYGIYSAYRKAYDVAPQQGLNEHVGSVGDKIECKLKVLKQTEIDGAYGTTMVISFEDLEGQCFKTFYSGSAELENGKSYQIKGTVKAHGSYQGKKETILTRIKVVGNE